MGQRNYSRLARVLDQIRGEKTPSLQEVDVSVAYPLFGRLSMPTVVWLNLPAVGIVLGNRRFEIPCHLCMAREKISHLIRGNVASVKNEYRA